mmetsp:Transcript_145127/g.253243  ORF Transcript_145127/g.253243 Transcript_145127/m.253243 type:complete len:267 (+) Transcript_145127:634-1434(+)
MLLAPWYTGRQDRDLNTRPGHLPQIIDSGATWTDHAPHQVCRNWHFAVLHWTGGRCCGSWCERGSSRRRGCWWGSTWWWWQGQRWRRQARSARRPRNQRSPPWWCWNAQSAAFARQRFLYQGLRRRDVANECRTPDCLVLQAVNLDLCAGLCSDGLHSFPAAPNQSADLHNVQGEHLKILWLDTWRWCWISFRHQVLQPLRNGVGTVTLVIPLRLFPLATSVVCRRRCTSLFRAFASAWRRCSTRWRCIFDKIGKRIVISFGHGLW